MIRTSSQRCWCPRSSSARSQSAPAEGSAPDGCIRDLARSSYSLAQTDSQAGIVALVVALILTIAFSGRLRPVAVVTVACFLLCSTVYYTFVTQPVALQTIGSESNVGARKSLWTVAWRTVHDHPVGGVGAGNFVVAEPQYAAQSINLPRADLVVRPELVHNSYLQVLAELESSVSWLLRP